MSVGRIVTAGRVRPVMQVAAGDVDVTVGQALYDTARYDQYPAATYSGLDAQWADDTCDVLEAVTFYGRERASDVFDIGTATLRVANPDGLWDYPATSDASPLVIRPSRQIRVGVIVDAGPPIWLWHGWIDATEPGYDPTVGDVVTVAAVCAKGEAGRVETVKLDDVAADETVTARLTRVADAAAFPAHRRQFDPSGVMLAGTLMGASAATLLNSAAVSSGGDIFGDQHGYLTYRGLDWQVRGSGDHIDGVIGNRGVDGEVCPNAWEVSFNRADFTSRVIYGRSGQPAAQLDDAANQALFGIETYKLTVETLDAGQAANLAARKLRTRSFGLAPRVAACTLNAARPGVVDLLAAASPFLPSVYTCGHVTGDGRSVFTRTLYLTGIEHTIDAGQWVARLALDDAAPWTVPADTRYDTARYNVDKYSRVA